MSPRSRVIAAIATGGAIGALARAGLGELIRGGAWPWATFTANIAGTAALAVLAALIAWRPHLPHWLHPLAAVGFCGSLTTFSALQLEAVLMMRDGRSGTAVSYVVSSIILGLITAIAGRRAVLTVTR